MYEDRGVLYKCEKTEVFSTSVTAGVSVRRPDRGVLYKCDGRCECKKTEVFSTSVTAGVSVRRPRCSLQV